MSGRSGSGRRVFLSHTAELREYPTARSFVAAAAAAVSRAGDVVVDMAYLTAADAPSAQVCREAVAACDVFVLICGFRYGSPVRDQPDSSYTEIEFDAATDSGIPRLVFMLDERTDGPAAMFIDTRHGARQIEFRARVQEAVTTAQVKSPDRLETLLLQALNDLSLPVSSTPVGPAWNIPGRAADWLAGRAALLENLRRTLANGGQPAAVALHGMGGVGKTSIAIEFAHRHRADYDVAWWISADDPARTSDGLATLAQTLGCRKDGDPSVVAAARLKGLLRDTDRWLLIFDDATDPTVVRGYLPPGPGHVLITSRNPDWQGAATGIPVAVLDREESTALIRRRLPAVQESDADRLADGLGDLPLAIEQATSLLDDTGLSPEEYLHLLGQRATDVLDATREHQETSAAASWMVAFDRLAADDPVALHLLCLIAWLAPEPVPLSMVTRHPDVLPQPLSRMASDPLELAKRTRTLRRRGLAHVTGSSVELHRVPAALLRARFPQVDSGAGRGWAALAVLALHALVAGDPTGWRRLIPHIRTVTAADRDLSGATDEAAWLKRTIDDLGRPVDQATFDAFVGEVVRSTLTNEERVMINLMDPKDRARYLLQVRVQEKAEMAVLLSQLQSLRHQTAMSIINNIR